jgi:hypothetical protein
VLAFATNLDPCALADGAFLRRVPNKIYLGPVCDEIFDQIFERVLREHGLQFEPSWGRTLEVSAGTAIEEGCERAIHGIFARS